MLPHHPEDRCIYSLVGCWQIPWEASVFPPLAVWEHLCPIAREGCPPGPVTRLRAGASGGPKLVFEHTGQWGPFLCPGLCLSPTSSPVSLARFQRALITPSTQEAQSSVRPGRCKPRPQLGSCSVLLAGLSRVEVLLVFYTVKFVHVLIPISGHYHS